MHKSFPSPPKLSVLVVVYSRDNDNDNDDNDNDQTQCIQIRLLAGLALLPNPVLAEPLHPRKKRDQYELG